MTKQYGESFKKTGIDLLADVKFKSFVDKLTEHEKLASHLPLSEQRKINAQLMVEHNKGSESIHRIKNLEIPGIEKNKIALRIYIPNESKNLPVLVYFHGGGWVFGSVEEADAVCRRLANHLDCIIASVEYRLAPEYPFQALFMDFFIFLSMKIVKKLNGQKKLEPLYMS